MMSNDLAGALVEIDDNGTTVVKSTVVADAFNKRHDNVVRDIRSLPCSDGFRRLNFEESSYQNTQGKIQPMYQMTRDGFSILVMGFTGPTAMQWKERFIEAFNAMETHIHQNNQPDQTHITAAVDQLRAEIADLRVSIDRINHRAGDDVHRTDSPEVAVVRKAGIVGPGHRCLKSSFYNLYIECCHAIGCLPSPMGVAMKALYRAFPDLKPGRAKVGGRPQPVINGLTIRKESQPAGRQLGKA